MTSRSLCIIGVAVVANFAACPCSAKTLAQRDSHVESTQKSDKDSIEWWEKWPLFDIFTDETERKQQELQEHFEKEHEWDKAIQLLEPRVIKHPDDAVLNFRLGRLYARAGNGEKGRYYLRKALELSPAFHQARFMMGLSYYWDHKYESAERELLLYLEKKPCEKQGLRALERLADRIARHGERGRALDLYCRLLNCDPKKLSYALKIARLLEKQGRTEDLQKLTQQCESCTEGDRYLLMRELDRAERAFYKTLENRPCNKHALNGLRALANEWRERKKYWRSIRLYRTIVACQPESKEDIYHMGRLYAWVGQRPRAIGLLQDALKIDSDYADAQIQLAIVYYWEDDLCAAKNNLNQQEDKLLAQVYLGKIALKCGDYDLAESYFRGVLDRDPRNEEGLLGLGDTLSKKLLRADATEVYARIVEHYPDQDLGWFKLFGAKKYSAPSFYTYFSNSTAKEADPPAPGWVVQTDYKSKGASYEYASHDRLHVEVDLKSYSEKEKLVQQNFRRNYYAELLSLSGKLTYTFPHGFTMHMGLRVKSGGNVGTNVLPFVDRTVFEPSLGFRFVLDDHHLSASAGYDSFISKNFAIDRTELISRKHYGASYGYRFPIYLRPRFGGSFRNYHYSDRVDNIQWQKRAYVASYLPFLDDYFTIKYEFTYRSFLKGTPNYYTFRLNRKKEVYLFFHKTWRGRTYLEFSYRRGWIKIKNLLAPIGDGPFASMSNRRDTHKYSALLRHRFKEHFRWEIEGSYFVSTFPYTSKKIKANILWEF